MEKLALIFAFLYIFSATCSWVGSICFSRKSYNEAFMAFAVAFFSLLLTSIPDFHEYNGMTWSIVGTCVVGGIQFVLLTISCFRDSPTKRELSKAKLEASAEMGDYMRPYYHQLQRVKWLLRLNWINDMVNSYNTAISELKDSIELCQTWNLHTELKERQAALEKHSGTLNRLKRCQEKIRAYEAKIREKYDEKAPEQPLPV